MNDKLRVGVLISGRGSNLQALIDACQDPVYPAQIVRVISNVPEVYGLHRAEAAGIPTAVVDHKAYDGREAFEAAVQEVLLADKVDLVVLAGFMRLVTDSFVRQWHDRLINIHPSLLPAFKGRHIHERVLAAGVRFSGCTVHFVRPAMDEGPIIVQAVVPVLSVDTPDMLAARVLVQEHRVLPYAVQLIAEGRFRVEEEKVVVTAAASPSKALQNPID
ncbi:MAG: phosphoribosylglycinamide formyltransferase [Magnetospiraceae bacterium]